MSPEGKVDSLEERLRQHAKSFDALLNLIPAKHYYSEDHSEQWQRKKQTKKQARAAKLAKLDPSNQKTAKDVLDERQAAYRKRKRKEEEDQESIHALNTQRDETTASATTVQQRNSKKQKKAQEPSSSRRGLDSLTSAQQGIPRPSSQKAASLSTPQRRSTGSPLIGEGHMLATGFIKDLDDPARPRDSDIDQQPRLSEAKGPPVRETRLNVPLLDQEKPPVTHDARTSPSSSSSRVESSVSDMSPNRSGVSSMTSILPSASPARIASPAREPGEKDNLSLGKSSNNPEELKRRLYARIEALRAARKADGPDGAPARSRQELLDARRRKEEGRIAHKKEQRRLAKEEESRKRAALLENGSPLMSPSPARPASAETPNHLTFGNVDFGKGYNVSADLNSVHKKQKGLKGPSDPGTALIAAEKKDTRLAGLDPAKREDILEKDRWLNAKKRAQGERIRDDGSLLKKTLKRKEKQKKKSTSDWRERIEGVKKRAEKKQKKREANLAKRRDEKRGKGVKSTNGKNRPGFEGSFRAKAPKRDGH